MERKWQAVMLLVAFIAFASVAQAQNVKITPIGLRTGDFCALDRALLFEDPTGVRILYDPGNSIAGPRDPRRSSMTCATDSYRHGRFRPTFRVAASRWNLTAMPSVSPAAPDPERSPARGMIPPQQSSRLPRSEQ